MKAAFKYILIWLLLTVVVFVMFYSVGAVVLGVSGVNDVAEIAMNPWLLAGALTCADLLLLLLFWKRRYTRNWVKYGFTYGEDFSTANLCLWTVLGAFGCLLLEISLHQYVPVPVDPEVEEWLGLLLSNPLGIVSACLIGPLAEEAIFRGAILRRLLEKKWNPWFAIVISAVFFALAHGNFEQGMTAIIMGCFMGWIYYRTRSIMPCFLVHAVNNTTAVVVAYALPESMAEQLGLPLSIGIPLIVLSLILIYVAARHIGKMTDDRTPVPVPADEVLPPLPPINPETTLPPEFQQQDLQ